ncbi:glycosyltransferase [Saccharothrix yanglingensis]|uniref:Glycosyl transferase family 2 n=1 Tax=Saccharothrix yanglingensis TaxID=659496 RepID=A0ABU0WTT8_9PSEU|nr:glycosyltransferase [Saccharothrix yanglingensis]MDQ2583252.1 glycosyl transferase family 2 [Saccharothrix yanglingensis]
MPTVSIITAAYAPKAGFLRETAASVAAQELPAGWRLEWVVQEDGVGPSLGPVLAGHDFVRYEAHDAQLGISLTRNLALSRASGQLVQVLDHDDVLLPGALALLLGRFLRNDIHWAVGAADDLLRDGTRRSWESALPFGLVEAGAVNRWAEEHGGNWPVHCAGLLMRTDSLRALGGWAGAPLDDDLVTFAALSELGAGWNERTVTWLYRQHADQTTRSGALAGMRDVGRRMALQRAKAVRNAELRFAPTAPPGFEGDGSVVRLGRNIKLPADLG